MRNRAASLRLGDWQALRFHVLAVYAGPPKLPHQVEPNRTTTVQAWLMEEGTVTVRTRLGRFTAGAGQWMLVTSGKLGHDFDERARILSMNLRAQWPDDRTLFRHDPPVILDAVDHPRLERAARTLLGLLPPPPKSAQWAMDVSATRGGLDLFVRHARGVQSLLEAYVEAMRQAGVPMEGPGGTDARVLEIIRTIDHLPRDAAFSQAELARRVGLSESQLHRMFVRETGMTPFNHYDQRRIEYAEHALNMTDMPIKTLAYTLGFKHVSHFSKWFSKTHDMPPRSYRKSHR